MQKILGTWPAVMDPKPGKIFMGCFDPKFTPAIRGLMEMLEIDAERDLIKRFAGGPVALAHPQEMPSRAKWLRKQLQFDCEKFESIEDIFAFMHGGCRYYDAIPNHCHHLHPGKERRDLTRVGGFLQHHFPEKNVRLFFGDFTDGTKTEVFVEEVQEFAIYTPERFGVFRKIRRLVRI